MAELGTGHRHLLRGTASACRARGRERGAEARPGGPHPRGQCGPGLRPGKGGHGDTCLAVGGTVGKRSWRPRPGPQGPGCSRAPRAPSVLLTARSTGQPCSGMSRAERAPQGPAASPRPNPRTGRPASRGSHRGARLLLPRDRDGRCDVIWDVAPVSLISQGEHCHGDPFPTYRLASAWLPKPDGLQSLRRSRWPLPGAAVTEVSLC